jgi:hypothetical protein
MMYRLEGSWEILFSCCSCFDQELFRFYSLIAKVQKNLNPNTPAQGCKQVIDRIRDGTSAPRWTWASIGMVSPVLVWAEKLMLPVCLTVIVTGLNSILAGSQEISLLMHTGFLSR